MIANKIAVYRRQSRTSFIESYRTGIRNLLLGGAWDSCRVCAETEQFYKTQINFLCECFWSKTICHEHQQHLKQQIISGLIQLPNNLPIFTNLNIAQSPKTFLRCLSLYLEILYSSQSLTTQLVEKLLLTFKDKNQIGSEIIEIAFGANYQIEETQYQLVYLGKQIEHVCKGVVLCLFVKYLEFYVAEVEGRGEVYELISDITGEKELLFYRNIWQLTEQRKSPQAENFLFETVLKLVQKATYKSKTFETIHQLTLILETITKQNKNFLTVSNLKIINNYIRKYPKIYKQMQFIDFITFVNNYSNSQMEIEEKLKENILEDGQFSQGYLNTD